MSKKMPDREGGGPGNTDVQEENASRRLFQRY